MPHNFLHLGLIQLLFPGARIIHCMREPMDTCLSIYFHNFNAKHAYASDLASTGEYHRRYQDIMAHWKATLSIPIMDVNYEELVADQERVSRELIEFCGLDWDDRVLQFHTSGRVVGTPSYDQVRQPIYKKSVSRWKNYAQHLAPLREALGMTD